MVIEMTPDNVHRIFDRNITIFARFYSPECRISRISKPEFEKAGEYFKKVIFLNIDCTMFSSVCNKYSIIGYPSYYLFPNGKIPYKVFTLPRTAESMIEFIEYNIYQFNPIRIGKSIETVNLMTYNSFFNSDGCKIINYHFVGLRSSYLYNDFLQDHIQAFRGDRKVKFGKMNCPTSHFLCIYVSAFPNTRIYNGDSLEFDGLFYNETHFLNTINQKCNTSRQINGHLMTNIGIDANLNSTILDFHEIYQKSKNEAKSFVNKFRNISVMRDQNEQNPYVRDHPTTKFICQLMNNILEYGPDILLKYKYSIQKQYADHRVSDFKLDDFDIKLNIVNAFIRCFYK